MTEPKTQTAGDAIRAALHERNMTQADLAWIVGWHAPDISNVVNGKRAISNDLAVGLAVTLGETPAYWLALSSPPPTLDESPEARDVRRRARVFEIAPLKQMQRRAWIPETEDLGELERALCKFFGVDSLEAEPRLSFSPRAPIFASPRSPEHRAWVFRAKQLAESAPAAMYDASMFPKLVAKMRRFAAYPAEVVHVAPTLAEYGVRFVVVEHLRGGSIDGASFWLDEKSPVVAMSARLDRIDSFWFTLFHELAHIKNLDAWSVDERILISDDSQPLPVVDPTERRANATAAEMLIDPAELESFIQRVAPLYDKDRIVQFARRIKLHPGIVVGQLQHRKEFHPRYFREFLVPIRDRLLPTTLCDGWGHAGAA
jgi:HTH-type transcriptional regulator/antitoxin HigA